MLRIQIFVQETFRFPFIGIFSPNTLQTIRKSKLVDTLHSNIYKPIVNANTDGDCLSFADRNFVNQFSRNCSLWYIKRYYVFPSGSSEDMIDDRMVTECFLRITLGMIEKSIGKKKYLHYRSSIRHAFHISNSKLSVPSIDDFLAGFQYFIPKCSLHIGTLGQLMKNP